MKERIVILGFLSHFPVAGVAWQTLHYLVGFARLGFDVYYVEAHGCTPSKLMHSETDDGPARAAAYIDRILRAFDLGDKWAYHAPYPESRYFGLSERQLRELYRSASIILNLHGSHLATEELTATNRLVYLETDPVEVEIDLFHNRQETLDYLSPHCAFFTYGENLGNADCLVPAPAQFRFLPTRQPVVLDFWDSQPSTDAKVFTTIGNWQQPWRQVKFKGEIYRWSKHFEFAKFIDLPRRASQPFELALSSYEPKDQALLESKGWRVRHALDFSQDLNSYRDYIANSRGEFTVAKDQNIRLRSGWFSDRAATYLAAGRPVITQETGFSNILPTGKGLFAFSTMDEILVAVESINGNYERQRRAASTIAREYFSHEVVLGRMLNDLGVSIPHALAYPMGEGRVRVQIPESLVLAPTGRWPTRLPEETLRTALALPVPVATESSKREGPTGNRGQQKGTEGTKSGAVSLFPPLAPVQKTGKPEIPPTPSLSPPKGEGAPWASKVPLSHRMAEGARTAGEGCASIVIVTYNALAYTKLCLTALLGGAWGAGDELIIVDNASTDGTPEYLRELKRLNPCVRVLFNARNVGFAPANNQALAQASGDVFILLNNDTLTPPGWRNTLVSWLGDREIGLIGPVTNRTCNEAQIDAPYRTYGEMEQFAQEYTQQHRGQSAEIGMLAMFCLAMRRDVFEKVGSLDEQFETGMFEDDDYARRVRQAGFRTVCAEDVFVHHFGQGSFGELRASGEYDRLLTANRRRFEEKWGVSWKPHGHRITDEYLRLRNEIKQTVAQRLPKGATIAVISMGDDELLNLNGHRGWHFPQLEDGAYAGSYPADSLEAIGHLEELRVKGANFLLIPRPALWWLDHYKEFAVVLERQYHCAVQDAENCLVFDLRMGNG
jgi:GT2 family glycosyltransferase